MPNALDSYGLQIKTADEITTDIQTRLRDGISPTLDVEEESELGECIAAFSAQLRESLELIQAGYNAQDPAQGSGFGLAQVASVTGTLKKAATRSVKYLDLNLNAGTYTAQTLIVHVTGDPTRRFRNRASVTSPGGVVTGVLFEAETPGIVRAPAGTLLVIAETVTGFNSVTSDPSDEIVGAPAESDTALRARRVSEIYRRGSTNGNAIRSDLAALSGVSFVAVLENDTDVTDANGLPPHSIECVVDGTATAQSIRDQIYASKAVGVQAYGTSSGTVTDSSGNTQPIAYSPAVLVPMLVSITAYIQAGTWSDNALFVAAVKETISLYFEANQNVGRDVLFRQLERVVLGLSGVIDAYAAIDTVASGVPAQANTTIGPRSRATIADANISVTVNVLTGPP